MLNSIDKRKALEKIADQIDRCERCKKNKSGLPVPGEGNQDAKIMFVGEAPGVEESKTGRPFIGRAGKFLAEILDFIGLEREEVFITSLVKYYPGKRTPNLEEIRHGMVHTGKQIEVIEPNIIVLLGCVALKALISEKMKITEVHGKIFERDNITFISTFHPAAAMRFPKIREKLRRDFEKIRKVIVERT